MSMVQAVKRSSFLVSGLRPAQKGINADSSSLKRNLDASFCHGFCEISKHELAGTARVLLKRKPQKVTYSILAAL